MLALVFGDDLLHLADDGHIIVGEGEAMKLLFVLEGLLIGIFANSCHLDLRMDGGLGLLGIIEDLLIELLAITQAGELDLDVLGTREVYHTLCEVGDAYGLAHVEDEDFTTLAHRASLEDELACFGDEHKEADDVWMGDGDGTSLAYLLTEDGDDRAVAAEDVAETSGDELGLRL